MTLSTQPYKGARDFYPEDERLRSYMFSIMRKTAEKFGYEAYDAPIIEPLELYLAKTSEEIVDEQTYSFEDRGGRKVTIRPEMTPSVSRMVAGKRQELAYPLRWYSIPNLWRYERPQRGRLREHWQFNADVFGLTGLDGDHEIILLADSIMQAFHAKREMYSIRLNSRKLMATLMHEYLQLDETQAQMMSRLIDRMNKMDYGEFVGQADSIFSPTQRDTGACDKLLQLLKVESLDGLPAELKLHASTNELRNLIELLEKSHIINATFDITLMRGFDYYTDIVFEVFDTHKDNNRSMFGGGRYDGLVGMFGVEPVATVGFGMGDVTLQNFLEVHELLPKLPPKTDAYVILIGDVYLRAQEAIASLRNMGLNIAVDSTGRKPDKQIKTAVKKDIKYALFIGDNELQNERFVLKDLHSGVEETHSAERLVSIIKDFRKSNKK